MNMNVVSARVTSVVHENVKVRRSALVPLRCCAISVSSEQKPKLIFNYFFNDLYLTQMGIQKGVGVNHDQGVNLTYLHLPMQKSHTGQ